MEVNSFKIETIFYELQIKSQENYRLPFFEPEATYKDPFKNKFENLIKYYNTYDRELIFENFAFFHSVLLELDDMPEYAILLENLINCITSYTSTSQTQTRIRINYKKLYKYMVCKNAQKGQEVNQMQLKVKIYDAQ